MIRASPSSPSRGHRRRRSSVAAASALVLLALLVFAGILGSTADAAISKKRAAKKKAAAEAKAAAAGASDTTIAEDDPPPGEVLVTCGSAIKLEHDRTGRLLGSQNIAYGGEGSGQMSVTASSTATDPGSVWLVKPALVSANDASLVPSCTRGQPLKSGDKVRLQHAVSRRWLHSHHFPSPLSRQLEVSAFGGESESDGLDLWSLEVDGGPGPWKRDGKVSFKHVETGAYLSSSGQRNYGHPLSGHSEVFGSTKGGIGSSASKDYWKAGEGVFYETTKTATAK